MLHLALLAFHTSDFSVNFCTQVCTHMHIVMIVVVCVLFIDKHTLNSLLYRLPCLSDLLCYKRLTNTSNNLECQLCSNNLSTIASSWVHQHDCQRNTCTQPGRFAFVHDFTCMIALFVRFAQFLSRRSTVYINGLFPMPLTVLHPPSTLTYFIISA